MIERGRLRSGRHPGILFCFPLSRESQTLDIILLYEALRVWEILRYIKDSKNGIIIDRIYRSRYTNR